jgi:hypothetical protein
MKKLTVLATFALVALAATGSPAQAQMLFESFETGLPAIGASVNQNPAVPLTLSSGTWFGLNAGPTPAGTGVFASTGQVQFVPYPDGTTSAAMNFNGNTGAGQILTYLMSPVLTLNNGDQISYRTISVNSTFPDRMRVMLSTNGAGTTAADFTTELRVINPSLTQGGYPSTWTLFTDTLSGLPGGGVSGRFAFLYDITDGGPAGLQGDLIGIDTVSYTPVPEPTSLALLGIPAAVVVWKRRRAKAAA